MPDIDDELASTPLRITPTGSVPVPDPTTLTTQIVNQAKQDLRREAVSQRETLETRMDGIDALITVIGHDVREQPILRASEIKDAINHLQSLQEEKFSAIQQQFNERDVRGEQDKKASKEALDAALLAQKESVSQQNDANTTAATKSETSFTKQIDQIGTLIATLEKSLTDRITELKERIDRGEGTTSGGASQRDQTRQDSNRMIAIYSLVASIVIGVAIVVVALIIHG